MGMVYLVGAGPGAAGLITVDGLEKLKQCDAVIYDRLAGEELLSYVKPDCEKIYVGKRAGKHAKKQEEINELLVCCAKEKDMVVRLKGGDPFVFGRGGEEIAALRENHIPYAVIPGVTSGVAVPEWAGIPVTHRGGSQSFHVFTGHGAEGLPPAYDYRVLAALEGTLVFLMGLSNLEQIAESLMAAGKSPDTPAAVICEGTTPFQRAARGKLYEIAEKVRREGLISPAIIVIGETAAYDLRCFAVQPPKVGIIATRQLWRKLKAGFEELSVSPVLLCEMQVQKTEQITRLCEELRRLDAYQWIAFTSPNGVELFFQEMERQDMDIRCLGGIQFAVLGSGTAARLREYGIKADFMPSQYQVPVFAREFAKKAQPGERVLLPRALKGSAELNEVLKEKGIDCCDIPVYDVAGALREQADHLGEMDYLVFASASGVTAFFAELRKKGLSVPDRAKLVCIGNATRKQLKVEYGEAQLVAAVSDSAGLIQAVREDLEQSTAG